MSIEVETKQPESPNGQLASLPTSTAGRQRPPLWRQRRFQLLALFVALAFVAALVSNNVIARQYTPEGAVRQYLSALQAGDGAQAWAAIQVTAPTAPVAATLTDRSALQAALTSGKPDIKTFTITATSQLDSATTAVEVTYDTSGGSKRAKFLVQRSGETHFGIYPVWHVVITPTVLEITLPKGSSGVSVDGKAIGLLDGKSTVAVLPVLHRLQVTGTAILAAQTIPVDAFFSLGQSATYKPALTPAGVEKAKAAIKAAFAACAQQTDSIGPDHGCPQDPGLSGSVSGQWSIVGDPTQDLTIMVDKDQNITGLGHYQMVFTYQSHGTQHLPAAGGYAASLVTSSADVALGAIANTQDAPALQRPAGATDQAIKDAVTKGFAQCAKSTVDFLADCPQELIDLEVSNISWSESADPLAGATINFDSSTGLISVNGNDTMMASYLSVGHPTTRASFTRTYSAELLWDGQGLQLVTIVGII